MKLKAKTKDCRLTVRVKLSLRASVDEQELNFFSRKHFRGFLKPKLIKRSVIEFSGRVGIPLYDRLKKPVSKEEFFFIMEQIVDAAQKLKENSLSWHKVVWDIHDVYINEGTREIQLLYLPLAGIHQTNQDVMDFIDSIVYSSQPFGEHDSGFVSRFAYFLRSLNGFDPDRIESFIIKEDPSSVNTIKKHYDRGNEGDKLPNLDPYLPGDDDGGATELLSSDADATDVLVDVQDDSATEVFVDAQDDDNATDVMIESRIHYPSLLQVLTGDTIPINKPVFRIGKERGYVDYCVTNNSAISRKHADIVTRGKRYFVIDLYSSNKTYINGDTLPAQYETEIFDGDQLRLGNEEFVFHV